MTKPKALTRMTQSELSSHYKELKSASRTLSSLLCGYPKPLGATMIQRDAILLGLQALDKEAVQVAEMLVWPKN